MIFLHGPLGICPIEIAAAIAAVPFAPLLWLWFISPIKKLVKELRDGPS